MTVTRGIFHDCSFDNIWSIWMKKKRHFQWASLGAKLNVKWLVEQARLCKDVIHFADLKKEAMLP